MTHGILNWKKCKKCREDFDIDTSKDKCPKCRRKKGVEDEIKGTN